MFIENNTDLQLLIPDKRTEFLNQKQSGISFKTVYIYKDILPEANNFYKNQEYRKGFRGGIKYENYNIYKRHKSRKI